MKARPWKTLSSKVLLNHPRMTIFEDIVELPDGKTTDYIRYAPTKTHSVAVIAVNDKQEMLLQREYSYPPNIIMWQLPGGSMRDGEKPIDAANRELSEESNVIGSTCREIGYLYVNNRRSDEKQFVVVCTGIQPHKGQRDEPEFIETHWVPLARIRSMISSGELTNVFLLGALNIYFAHNS